MKVETADRKGADPRDMVTTKIDEAMTYQVNRHQPTSWWWRQGPTGDPLPLFAVCDCLPSLSVSSLLKRASWWKVVLTSSAGHRHEPTCDTRMTRGATLGGDGSNQHDGDERGTTCSRARTHQWGLALQTDHLNKGVHRQDT
jgi:hypothetical protein